jgi:hypothetical protein
MVSATLCLRLSHLWPPNLTVAAATATDIIDLFEYLKLHSRGLDVDSEIKNVPERRSKVDEELEKTGAEMKEKLREQCGALVKQKGELAKGKDNVGKKSRSSASVLIWIST